MQRPKRIAPGPGQESVWDYPRPPRLEDVPKQLQVIFNGTIIADTTTGKRVVETAGAPVYYVPPEDILMNYLTMLPHYRTICEWKGAAVYYNLDVDGKRVERAAWSYLNPTPAYITLRDYIAFYPHPMDACLVDGEMARPQPGGFYGGWITDNVIGPFKGEPGTEFW
jgi:uncharacterized protein (DUF427 family)